MSRANQPGVFVCGGSFWLLATSFWPQPPEAGRHLLALGGDDAHRRPDRWEGIEREPQEQHDDKDRRRPEAGLWQRQQQAKGVDQCALGDCAAHRRLTKHQRILDVALPRQNHGALAHTAIIA